MPVPKKILYRKDEITADFFKLVDIHISELLAGKIDYLFHAKHFAEKLFIHPRHLSNTIKLTTGISPCEIMEDRIMAEAYKMLEQTNMPIAEIGFVFAYNDPTNFTKFFKSMANITPLQYRKNFLSKSIEMPLV